jgi:alpha-galactosidase
MRTSCRTAAISLVSLLAVTTPISALDNGLARTPPMGWNSWNHFGRGINETLIRQTADAMMSSGMKAVGYQYINLDNGWASANRDAAGNLVTDPVKFPSGMKALADYIHSKGLKLGIYGDRGTYTCGGNTHSPGSQGYEVKDAILWASFGIDLLKNDNCWVSLDMQTQYVAMRDALAACGRPIVYSICAWVFQPWMPETGNLWRTTNDIKPNWTSILGILDTNSMSASYAKPGAWNDPDMLEVGNAGLSDVEGRAHFSLWAMMAAPLITGNDLLAMSAATLATLTNAEVIAVDQDSLGRQGTRVRTSGGIELWSKPLRDSSKAVLVFNRNAAAGSLSFTLAEVGVKGSSATVRDLWAHVDKGQVANSYSVTVQPHDVAMFRLVDGATRSEVRRVEGRTSTGPLRICRTTISVQSPGHYRITVTNLSGAVLKLFSGENLHTYELDKTICGKGTYIVGANVAGESTHRRIVVR